MKNIHIKTTVVLARLEENFVKYGATVEAIFAVWKEANEKYIVNYREWMVQAQNKAEGKIIVQKPSPPIKPTDRSREYEAWIDYFGNDENEIQELSYLEFVKFCRDVWSWKANHIQDMGWYLDTSNIAADSISSDKIHALNASFTSYTE